MGNESRNEAWNTLTEPMEAEAGGPLPGADAQSESESENDELIRLAREAGCIDYAERLESGNIPSGPSWPSDVQLEKAIRVLCVKEIDIGKYQEQIPEAAIREIIKAKQAKQAKQAKKPSELYVVYVAGKKSQQPGVRCLVAAKLGRVEKLEATLSLLYAWDGATRVYAEDLLMICAAQMRKNAIDAIGKIRWEIDQTEAWFQRATIDELLDSHKPWFSNGGAEVW